MYDVMPSRIVSSPRRKLRVAARGDARIFRCRGCRERGALTLLQVAAHYRVDPAGCTGRDIVLLDGTPA